MTKVDSISEEIFQLLTQKRESGSPDTLYEPIEYLLNLGGKRLRPALCVEFCRMLGGDVGQAAYPAAAIELFHNFSLMHDDIMDEAPLRRGQASVHKKWNVNQAILSGDAMLVMAYDELIKLNDERIGNALKVFNAVALEVCEGQQLDMDFEDRNDVSVDEYLEMIRLKTSVLLAASCELGAITAGANESVRTAARDFGLNLGLSFQLKDDYLDAFGEAELVGKQTGGDILADKKTYLIIRSKEVAGPEDLQELNNLIGNAQADPIEKVERVKSIIVKSGVDEELLSLSQDYYSKAMEALSSIQVSEELKQPLFKFAEMINKRVY